MDYAEIRYTGLGYVNERLVNVVYTKRQPDIIRIISFRKVNSREKNRFENGT